MPLLASERKAARARLMLYGVLGLTAVAGASIGVALLFLRGEPEAELEVLEAAVIVADDDFGDDGDPLDEGEEPEHFDEGEVKFEEIGGGEPDEHGAQSGQFGRAKSFRQAMVNAGLSPNESTELEQALTGVLDFRRCRENDTFSFKRDAQGRLVHFQYHASALEYVVAERDARGKIVARKVERAVAKRRIAAGGVIRTSLGDAVEEAGLGRSIVGIFVEAFNGRADFHRDTREGDSFRIIVDEERLDGELRGYGRALALEYRGRKTGVLRAYLRSASEEESDYYDENGHPLSGAVLAVPCRYDMISSPFNPRRLHPVLKRVRPHNGTDFAAPTGTPVVAAAEGVVTWSGPKGPNGNLVSIRHANGYQTHYAHLHRIERGISVGTKVKRRQRIGQVGTTGRSTGPHLHFGVHKNGQFVDPMKVLNEPGSRLRGKALSDFQAHSRKLSRKLEAIPLARR
jgi:murein DD-endopeptidase MepM/ murein hydrolase activator NlpD